MIIKREGKLYSVYHDHMIMAKFESLDEASFFIETEEQSESKPQLNLAKRYDNHGSKRRTKEQKEFDRVLGNRWRGAENGPAIEYRVEPRARGKSNGK